MRDRVLPHSCIRIWGILLAPSGHRLLVALLLASELVDDGRYEHQGIAYAHLPRSDGLVPNAHRTIARSAEEAIALNLSHLLPFLPQPLA